MLKLSLLELFIRAIPEGIAFIFSGYVFFNKKLNINKILLSGIILGISFFMVRLLPIHFGVHTILSIILFITLQILISKLDIFKSILCSLITFILMFICELLNVFVVTKILNVSAEIFSGEPFIKILYSIPSLVLFFLVILIIYFLKRNANAKEARHVSN